MSAQRDTLLAAAREAAEQGYAPYSGFHVGAALAFADGSVVTGANVENASYGLSLCAETVALASAMNLGKRGELVAVAVTGGKSLRTAGAAPVTPCGGRPPNGIKVCQNEVVADLRQGGRPWNRLPELEWIRQSMCFSCMG